MIKNAAIRINEKNWIETLLSEDFLGRGEIINQINCAEILREYTEFYMALKFKVDNNKVQKIQTNIRVPVEMRVHRTGQVPIQFLLHIVQGYVSELEIFNADSSKIDMDINLENAKVEIVINPELAF